MKNDKIQRINPKMILTAVSLAIITACTYSSHKQSTQQTIPSTSQPKSTPDIETIQVSSNNIVVSEQQDKAVRQLKVAQKQMFATTKMSVMPRNISMPRPILPSPIERPIINEKNNNEQYLKSLQNPVKQVVTQPLSTFSIDVDTGSYSNSRRMINAGQLPPSDAVREEAFINYFNYDYLTPASFDVPFNIHTEMAAAPWNAQRQLLHIGIKGFEIEKSQLKAANLVFLLDVSGSMNAANKLPLLKSSLKMLTKQLDEDDSVAIVVYAGAAGVVLDASAGNEHQKISQALDTLSAGGSTNGQQGIELAYQIAQKNFKKGGVNRVILATDGDFNVGTQSLDELKALIANKRETGIALTTLGFGQGNYNDALMEQLANIGNGQHAYIDNLNEARKVLVDELSSTMQIIAKDVKVQVEFNPQLVAEYRLIGYQNRLLANEDFNNDNIDAAELGAGHTVTAIYELTMANSTQKHIDDLRYSSNHKTPQGDINTSEVAFVKVRYKQPTNNKSQLISHKVLTANADNLVSSDFKFAAAVAGFAQMLKGAKYLGQWHYNDIATLANQNKGDDPFGYRSEFIQLVKTAAALQ
ncbi:VWA domain-containing protein [Pseudoalteromonas sp. MMG010]|uniref:vWA domain-containing protein n=1 Tax=Pseudoalteromonas sp. MMG010 TaxID=2822685 RepID=UPI001B39F4BB|nr:VWA domain-containing protein [Pseudoalteromonas sp. MMG010]MBQ4832109.1 VWA domain-containing protein [Pseudoalteromonas sp. MMG010]